jgi:hypothetical protein
MQPSSQTGSKFTSAANPNKRREREEMLYRTMRLLEHASACIKSDCTSKGCWKVKKLHAHARTCEQMVSGGCALCKHMWCLLNLHAKQCTKRECPVPRCQCGPLICLLWLQLLRPADALHSQRSRDCTTVISCEHATPTPQCLNNGSLFRELRELRRRQHTRQEEARRGKYLQWRRTGAYGNQEAASAQERPLTNKRAR